MYSGFRSDLHERSIEYIRILRRYLNGEMSIYELESIQLEKLISIIEFSKNGSEFYSEKLINVDVKKINEINEDIKLLPFTTKVDLREAGSKILSQPISDAWVYYETTGTTGPSTPCPRNEEDSLVNNSFLTLKYKAIFDEGGDSHIVGIMGPTELHSTGDTFEDVFRSLGHTVVKMWPRSPVVGMNRVIRLIQELKITALVCTPAVASEVVRYCEEKSIDIKGLDVRVIMVLGELITPNRLNNLGAAWGAKIYNCMYASQETSILAAVNKNNKLQTIPLNNHYELIDPETEVSIKVLNKEVTGELVVTTLYKGNKPLIRYRTGDMIRAKKTEGLCWDIEPIGRVKDIVKISGKNIYAFDLERLIFEDLKECYEYCLEISEDAEGDNLCIVLEECSELTDTKLISAIEKKIANRLSAKVNISVGSVSSVIGTGAMVSWKAARINDLRQGQNNNDERTIALEIASHRAKA